MKKFLKALVVGYVVLWVGEEISNSLKSSRSNSVGSGNPPNPNNLRF